MGLRFRKSFKIAPGVRVNLNKKSASISVGTKGVKITKSTSGRTTTTVGIPGTGVSYSKTTTSNHKTLSRAKTSDPNLQLNDNKHREKAKYPPRRPAEYVSPSERQAAESVHPTQPADAMMAAYKKNPKGYTRQMKIMKVFAPILCALAAVLMLASPIPFAILYLIGIGFSTMPRTFKEKQAEQLVTPFYKRRAVIGSIVFLVFWLILCMSV